ncbi:hypothetical protein HDU97_010363 [Phlyctochytrium planicorne]|nr:hypothetical protein HDU97_010363 [Phlyctochytrium planicorne]
MLKSLAAISSSLVLLGLAPAAMALENGLGRTPAMGWNSWSVLVSNCSCHQSSNHPYNNRNLFACEIDENIIRETADTIIARGLDKVGYKYVNLDDCWQLYRDLDGYIVEDARTFPSGMKALADYIHSKGLKFGLYSSAGTFTCQGRPGSLRHEYEDAESYAKWDVDYLKLDNCYNEGGWDRANTIFRYGRMRDALNATGRPIYYSQTCAAMNLLDENADKNVFPQAAPGGFNDLDMLEVGNGGMNIPEYRSHFSAWSALKSPLLLGNDLRSMTDDIFEIIANEEVIAINQDPLGVSARRVFKSSNSALDAMKNSTLAAKQFLDVWVGPLSNGDRVLFVLNRGESDVKKFGLDLDIVFFEDGKGGWYPAGGFEKTVRMDEGEGVLWLEGKRDDDGEGAKRKVFARDLWKKKDSGPFSSVIEVGSIPSHDVAMFRVSQDRTRKPLLMANSKSFVAGLKKAQEHPEQPISEEPEQPSHPKTGFTVFQGFLLVAIFVLLCLGVHRAYLIIRESREGQIRLT